MKFGHPHRLKCSSAIGPMLNLDMKKENGRMAYNFHLLFNNSSPQKVMKTIQNPSLQFDPKQIPKITNPPMSYSPFRDATIRTAPTIGLRTTTCQEKRYHLMSQVP